MPVKKKKNLGSNKREREGVRGNCLGLSFGSGVINGFNP
jgi:hypothetical protein